MASTPSQMPPTGTIFAHKPTSTRRGSVSAADPWGNHATLNDLSTSRSSSSTLTIVRVNNEEMQSEDSVAVAPSSPRRLAHRRAPSNDTSAPTPQPGRLSFAFSSFARPKSSGPPTTGNTSFGGRPSSPTSRPHQPPSASSFNSKPRLTADQLVNLAHNSTNPKKSSICNSPRSAPNSPRINSIPSNTTPATFRPLDADVYVPFIDRPSEVAALISSAPSSKLFSLLAQTFPKRPTPSSDTTNSTDDAKNWSYDHLIAYLTTTTRNSAPDAVWVSQIRKCILSHSELIWERVKGALGVPAELDCEGVYNHGPFGYMGGAYSDENAFDTESSEEEVMSENHLPTHGHWADWDSNSLAVPVVQLPPAVLDLNASTPTSGMDAPPPSAVIPQRGLVGDSNDLIAGVSSALKLRPSALLSPSPFLDSESENETDIIIQKRHKSAHVLRFEHEDSPESQTPVARQSPPADQSVTSVVDAVYAADQESSFERTHKQSYEPQYEFESELDADNSPSLSIEAVMSKPGDSASPPALSLQGISEDAEDAEEEETEAEIFSPRSEEVEPEVQGLRISTPSSRIGLAAMLSPGSPYLSGIHSSASVGSGLHSRTTSFGSLGGFRRSDSVSSLTGYESLGKGNILNWKRRSSSSRGGSEFAIEDEDRGAEESDVPYDPLAERTPGNPLFPSNFARLSVGPTLVANNPSLRSPSHPPLSRFNASSIQSNVKASSVHSSARSPLVPALSSQHSHDHHHHGDSRKAMSASKTGMHAHAQRQAMAAMRGNRFHRLEEPDKLEEDENRHVQVFV